jgi:hypothetical protein
VKTRIRINPISLAIFVMLLVPFFSIHAQDTSDALHPGIHQAEGEGITLSDGAQVVDAEGAQLGKAVETTSADFVAYGTDVTVRWRSVDTLTLSCQCDAGWVEVWSSDPATVSNTTWQEATIYLSNQARNHQLRLTAASHKPWLIDTIAPIDKSLERFVLPVTGILLKAILESIVVIVVTIVFIRWCLRLRRRKI